MSTGLSVIADIARWTSHLCRKRKSPYDPGRCRWSIAPGSDRRGYRIGIAHEHLAVREHDIVIAAGLGRNGVGQRLADRAVFGIDDAQRRIAVLVLQRPDLAGNRIELQTIDIAVDLIGMVDFAGVIIFDDGAVTDKPVESAPLVWATQISPFASVMESGAELPVGATANVEI